MPSGNPIAQGDLEQLPVGQPALFVSGLIWRDGQILLMQQRSNTGELVWGLPIRPVAEDELAHDTLGRMVLEFTGLQLESAGPLLFVVQLVRPETYRALEAREDAPKKQTTILAFEATAVGDLAVKDDRFDSGSVTWLALDEALEWLGTLQERYLREPVSMYLRGQAIPGSTWMYRGTPSGTHELAFHTPPLASPRGQVTKPRQNRQASLQDQLSPEQQQQYSTFVLGCMAIAFVILILIVVGVVSLIVH